MRCSRNRADQKLPYFAQSARPGREGEPVTPTRKVKRKLMYERFKTLIEDMYNKSEERLIAAGTGGVLKL